MIKKNGFQNASNNYKMEKNKQTNKTKQNKQKYIKKKMKAKLN